MLYNITYCSFFYLIFYVVVTPIVWSLSVTSLTLLQKKMHDLYGRLIPHSDEDQNEYEMDQSK